MFAKTYTFSPSTTIRSAEVNQNFDDCIDGLNTAAPSGLIAMFSGAIVDIPSGWYLCNGSNSTPDLRNKFVIGAGDTYAVGATGGEATHTLTTDEMPSHSHSLDSDTGDYGGGVAGSMAFGDSSPSNPNYTGMIGDTGGGGAHNNLPPYHSLAYIMKS